MRDRQAEKFLKNSEVQVCGLISFGKPECRRALADVLEPLEAVDSRWLLSPKACAGILARAAKRGKTVPEDIRKALEAQAQGEIPPKESGKG